MSTFSELHPSTFSQAVQMMRNLTQSLADLWNKIRRGSFVPTMHISGDSIVVFVVGPTGSGKSWFTKEATKSDLVKASRDYHPFTGEVQAIQCELIDEAKKVLQEGIKKIVFVDTPSFLTECDHLDARRKFEEWFRNTEYEARAAFVGVIYIHRVETDPRLEPIQNHLQEFSAALSIGDARVPRRLRVVVSYDKTSGTVSPEKIKDRTAKLSNQLEQLKKTAWKPSIHKDIFQGEPEVAWSAVAELFRD